jgi:hypothetical protein
MSTNAESADNRHRIVYWIALGLFIVLVLIGLLTYSSAKSTANAQDKANQLAAALQTAGARVPSQDQIVRVLGDDGGATCEDPGSALRRSILYGMLTNGAAGPGIRPVIADKRVVRGQLLVIQIYCPEEIDKFKEVVNDLHFDNVVKQ